MLVTDLGVRMARAEIDAAISAATRPDAPVAGTENLISSEAYHHIGEALSIDLVAAQRGSNAYVTALRTCHVRGTLTDVAISLQKVRLEQSLTKDSSYEELGAFTLKFRADKDNVINTVADFFRLFFVWKWAPVAVGSIQVTPPLGHPHAGMRGDVGDVDGGRVYVTQGGLEQYTYLHYTVCHLGVDALLALHHSVMRQVGDFMLTKDFGFASALMAVLNANTAATLLPRDVASVTGPRRPAKGKGHEGDEAARVWRQNCVPGEANRPLEEEER